MYTPTTDALLSAFTSFLFRISPSGSDALHTLTTDMPTDWAKAVERMHIFAPVLTEAAAIMKPDLEIGTDRVYLRRWFIHRNKSEIGNLFLHQLCADDDDRALHDHPWVNVSIPLGCGYIEHTPEHPEGLERRPYEPVAREATDRHRLSLRRDARGTPMPSWSLFLTGPKIREWGFDCPKGWVHWRDFTAGPRGEGIGKGCGE